MLTVIRQGLCNQELGSIIRKLEAVLCDLLLLCLCVCACVRVCVCACILTDTPAFMCAVGIPSDLSHCASAAWIEPARVGC